LRAMTADASIVAEAESLVRELAEQVTQPAAHECLGCYVWRMLGEFPCNGSHRHAFRYRDAMAPRASALADRLSRIGACCCDCEIFLNGYEPRAGRFTDEQLESGRDDMPPCQGVRRGSVQPCPLWVRIRRGW
jgi:hypothetical protein